jgi:uncharacterized membrane protein
MRSWCSVNRFFISMVFLLLFACYMVLALLHPQVATPIGIGLVALVLAFSFIVHAPRERRDVRGDL